MPSKEVPWKSYEIKNGLGHDWLMKVLLNLKARESEMLFTAFDQQAAQFYCFEISYENIDKSLKSLHVLSSKEQICEIFSQIYGYIGNDRLLVTSSSDFCFKICFLESHQEVEVSISIVDELNIIFRVPCNLQKESLHLYKELLSASGKYLQNSQYIINQLVDLVSDKIEVLHECRDMLVESGKQSFLDQLQKTNAQAFDNFHYKNWALEVMAKQSYEQEKAEPRRESPVLELDPFNLKQSPPKKRSPLKVYSGSTASKRKADIAEFVNPENTKKILMPSLKASDDFSSASTSPKKKTP